MTASTDRASPLSEWAARLSAAGARAFSICEVPCASQVNLRGKASDAGFAANASAALGCDLPVAANTWASGAACAVLWLGPDEWLVVAPDGRSEAICRALRESLTGTHCSVVDLSANRTIIEIAGSEARVVLAKGCPLDLHSSAFGSGQCAQSLLAKAQVILQCVDDDPTFRIFVRISFAAYVAEWLLDAAAELRASRDAGMLGLRL